MPISVKKPARSECVVRSKKKEREKMPTPDSQEIRFSVAEERKTFPRHSLYLDLYIIINIGKKSVFYIDVYLRCSISSRQQQESLVRGEINQCRALSL